MDPLTLIVLAVAAGIIFDLTNGWNDSANAIATVISTRVMSPWQALGMSAALNVIGALVSVKVAKTMGAGIVGLPADLSSVAIVLAAMIGAAGWVTWCTMLGLPISCSHSLVGGLVGATYAVQGAAAVQWAGFGKIILALFISPVAGFLISYGLLLLVTWIARGATPRGGKRTFGLLQIGSSAFMAFEHGKNDAQKVMGVIALALFAGGFLKDAGGAVITDLKALYIPLWVKIACATAMGVGTAVGGWRVIRTIGTKLAKITTTEGFAAETGAGVVLEVAASLGVPVSTTHTITGGILGVGSAKGIRAVKWGIGAKIFYAWVFTLPMCFLFAFGLSWFSARTSPGIMTLSVLVLLAATFLVRAWRRSAGEKRGAVTARA
jgi:PiT family inorganic phosphate transporter